MEKLFSNRLSIKFFSVLTLLSTFFASCQYVEHADNVRPEVDTLEKMRTSFEEDEQHLKDNGLGEWIKMKTLGVAVLGGVIGGGIGAAIDYCLAGTAATVAADTALVAGTTATVAADTALVTGTTGVAAGTAATGTTGVATGTGTTAVGVAGGISITPILIGATIGFIVLGGIYYVLKDNQVNKDVHKSKIKLQAYEIAQKKYKEEDKLKSDLQKASDYEQTELNNLSSRYFDLVTNDKYDEAKTMIPRIGVLKNSVKELGEDLKKGGEILGQISTIHERITALINGY